MLKRRTIYVFAMLLSVITANAQVNLQTGSAIFSIPMFNWQDDKSRLNALVALSYNSGNGLHVSDVASNEGQGWNLVAGGVISRMQVGEPDDQQAFPGTVGNDQDISRYPNGWLYSKTPVVNGCPNALTKYPIYPGLNTHYTQHNVTVEDRQPDYFTFQFNGKSGSFVLDSLGTDLGQPLGFSKMIIKYQTDPTMTLQGIRTTITSFTIQDVDGLIYKFAQHGLAQVLHVDYCDPAAANVLNQPQFGSNNVYYQAEFVNSKIVNPYIINNWYLSEIDDPLTGRKITFNYVIRSISTPSGNDISYNKEGNYSIVTFKKSITQTPELVSASFPDGHTVNFNYSSTGRVDLNGEYALSTVDILYQGRALSEYQLNTSYIMLDRSGTPANTSQQGEARLYLRSVKKIGVDLKEDSPPYLFDYYMGSGNGLDDVVPPPFSFTKDIWGYYNGSNSVAYDNSASISPTAPITAFNNTQLRGLCFLNTALPGQVYLNPKAGYAKNGLLKQIVYPTGGSLTYQYGQNAGTLDGTNYITVGGVHVTQTSSADGGFSNGCSNPITTQYNYVMNGVGSNSSLWGLEPPVNSLVMQSHYAPEWLSYHWSFSNCGLFGCCYWHYLYPGILSQTEAIDLSDFQKFMQTWAPELGAVSLISDIMDIANVILGGAGFFAWAAAIVDVIGGLVTLGITCFGSSNTRDNTYTTYYSSDLNGASPLPAQFKRVEITESPGTIGKTVEQFTHGDPYDATADYALWVRYNKDFVARQRFAPWAYGLPKLISVYDVKGNLVKQTQNTYDFLNAQWFVDFVDYYDPNFPLGGSTTMFACKCMVKHSYSQRWPDWTDPTKYDLPSTYQLAPVGTDMDVNFYGMFTGIVHLTMTDEKTFRTSDPTQYVDKVTTYGYNFFNYEVSNINVTQSNGSTLATSISYPEDYYYTTQNAMLIKLVQNNILTLPVSTLEQKTGGPGSAGYLSEKVTEFTQVTNGDIRPGRTLEHRFAQPAGSTPYSPDNVNNPSIYKVPQVNTYDLNSNLVGVKDEGGRSVTDLYGYNDKYIVATVINADPNIDKCAYSSFESSDISRSGWTITGFPTFNTNIPSPTGTGNFELVGANQNSLTAGSLNTARPYILSLWCTGVVSVNAGATLVKSAPTINGFTYYEYNIPQGATSVTVSNGTGANCMLDELRLYPASARMRTTTYDPLIGKTSECDENNRIQYYQYDNLGRLRMIQDENHYALKMYEYNNVSPAKQNGCPGTYTNNPITESFTKTCGPGYLGTQVSYTEPPGKFSSVLNQGDADAQAENDLLINGQANANTNGVCQLLYYNTPQSMTLPTQSCIEGYQGGSVTYTVPAGRYSSLINVQDANNQAQVDLNANAQDYANSPDHQNCTKITTPDWTWPDGGPFNCQSVGGTEHEFILETDMNPFSSTYNLTRWSDIGPQNSCPAGTPATVTITLINSSGSSTNGYTASFVPYAPFFFPGAETQTVVSTTLFPGQYNISILPGGSPLFHQYTLSMSGTTLSSSGTSAQFGNVLVMSNIILVIH